MTCQKVWHMDLSWTDIYPLARKLLSVHLGRRGDLQGCLIVAMSEVSSEDEAAATGAETRAALLKRAKWIATNIDGRFVQLPRQGTSPRAGQLASLVKRGDKRGLNAYLFLASVISSGDGPAGWSTVASAGVWARALGTDLTATGNAATNAVSKVFRRLEARNLIKRDRVDGSRGTRITLLNVDGSGGPYERPRSQFLQLNHQYFYDGWFERLDLPAIAMLLVLLKERDTSLLPSANFPAWYGWSADTAERGFGSLVDHGLVKVTKRLRTAPLSPTGRVLVNDYRLTSVLRPPPRRRATVTTAAAQPEGPTSLLTPDNQPSFADLLRKATPGPWETT